MTSRIDTISLKNRKGATRIVVLTAYTAPIARLLDESADMLLVGDSLGMVLYGMESTLPVTLDMMIQHGRAVVNASKKACVIVDMPFGSYQASKEDAFRAAARIMAETGCSGVKLEGGIEMADTVAYLTERAIPVLGHVGLMPQHVHRLGGYRYQGRTQEERAKILADAHAIEKAGAFGLVLEAVEASCAKQVSQALAIPTIGIGASADCDGQVLVIDDALGITEKTPRFVKRYAELGATIQKVAQAYAEEVRAGTFPTKAHGFSSDQ